MTSRQPVIPHTIRIEGTFDRVAAAALRVQLVDCEASEIVIDFAAAGDVQDLGLAALVQGLKLAARPRVAIRGLSRHHGRMLKYLGLDVRPGVSF